MRDRANDQPPPTDSVDVSPAALPSLRDPRLMFLSPLAARSRLCALCDFVDYLLDIGVRGARNVDAGQSPLLLQLKLAWWRDSLADIEQPDWSPPAGEPLLQAVAHHWSLAYRQAKDSPTASAGGEGAVDSANGWVAMVDAVEILLCADGSEAHAQRTAAARSLGAGFYRLSRRGASESNSPSPSPSRASADETTPALSLCATGHIWGLLRGGLAIAMLDPEASRALLTEAIQTAPQGQRQHGLERSLYMLDLWSATVAQTLLSQSKRRLWFETILLARVGMFGR